MQAGGGRHHAFADAPRQRAQREILPARDRQAIRTPNEIGPSQAKAASSGKAEIAGIYTDELSF